MFSNSDPSVYQRVLGEELAALHPQLQAYVGTIPVGCRGVGRGRYEEAGLRCRALRPLFAVLARRAIAFPERGDDVPFDVCNEPTTDGGLRAARTFGFVRGERTMIDYMRVVDGRLVDRLGRRGELEVELAARADRGALVLESRRLALRVGRWRVPLPRVVRVRLEERVAVGGGQHVAVQVGIVGLGEVYGYRGTFAYEIRRA